MCDKTENLKSISVNELIVGANGKKYCFFIPSYQRGYRWEKRQIETLLNDLLEFHGSYIRKDASVGEFYCLQPIIVKHLDKSEVLRRMGKYIDDEDYYEVVDGQQRLITIFIILKSFYERNPQYFDLEFERDAQNKYARKQCLLSLGPAQNNGQYELADEQYFRDAYNIILNWLTNRAKTVPDIEAQMQTALKRETKIIWYEITSDPNIDCYAVFRNINNGKIPLTDAELVKAMLLNSRFCSPETENGGSSSAVKREQERYARLWDEMQRSLQNDRFWGFITGNHFNDLSPKINFYLKVAVKQKSPEYNQEGELRLFSYYEDKMNSLNVKGKRDFLHSAFDDLRKIFRTVQDWYDSPEIYNYIGFIMTYKGKTSAERLQTLANLIDIYEKKTHTQFIAYLKDKIKTEILENKLSQQFLSEANYEEHRAVIEKLLMLFNIAELNEIGGKFDFSANVKWSIEHIKAQHSKFAASEDIVAFLDKERRRINEFTKKNTDVVQKEKCEQLIKAIDDLKSSSIKEEDFVRLAARIDSEFDDFDEADLHRLGNLALLSEKTNSALNNSPFYEKRNKLLPVLDDPQSNIPYSTKKVFLKMYTPQEFDLDFTKWDKRDFNAYHQRQCEMLALFTEKNNG